MNRILTRKLMLLSKIQKVFLIITLFSVVFFCKNVNAAYFKYKDFNAEEFYKSNEKIYENIFDKTKDNESIKSYLDQELKFYTKLYHELALYEERGYFIDDNIIIATYNSGTSAAAVANNDEYKDGTPFNVNTHAVNFAEEKIDEDLTINRELYCGDDNPYSDEDVEASYDCDHERPTNTNDDDNESHGIRKIIGRIVKKIAELLHVILGEATGEILYDYIEENDFETEETEEGELLRNYYSEDIDTIIMLIRNMIAYKTSCYLIRSEVKKCPDPEDSSKEIDCCENEEDSIIEVPRGDGRGINKFLPMKKRCGRKSETFLPHFKYFVSKKENTDHVNRVFLKSGEEIPEPNKTLYLYERYVDEYYNSCLDSFLEEDFKVMKYTYDGEDHVETDFYFDFLVSTRYFDQKAQFNSSFSGILLDAGVDCLSSKVCSNSLERKGLYSQYKHQIIQHRYWIVLNIISMLRAYGLDIVYHPDPLLGLIDEEYGMICTGFMWPSGSVATTTRNGKQFADGMPPTSTRITSKFGPRTAPTAGASTNHKGIDIGQADGTNVVASKAGKVVFAGEAGGYGNVVYIDHEGGYQTRYAHNSRLLVSVGEYVEAGQVIALCGHTGIHSGPHIHFEVRLNGTAMDPLNFVDPDDPRGSCEPIHGPGTGTGEGCNITNPCGEKSGENAKQALCQALWNNGYNNYAIAGILTNTYLESGFDTCAFNCSGGNLGAFGIAQWRATRQSNLTSMQNFEKAIVQAQYLVNEAAGRTGCKPGDMNNSIIPDSSGYRVDKDPTYLWCRNYEVYGSTTAEVEKNCTKRAENNVSATKSNYAYAQSCH